MPSVDQTLEDLSQRILAGYPVLLLQTHEEVRWERELTELAVELDRGLATWSLTAGWRSLTQPAHGKIEPQLQNIADDQTALSSDPSTSAAAVAMLETILDRFPGEQLLLLKDFQRLWEQPAVVRKLRDLIPMLIEQSKTVLVMGPEESVPFDLLKDVAVIELPLPRSDQMRSLLQSLLTSHPALSTLRPSEVECERLVHAILGLTWYEARKALLRALQGCEQVDEEVFVRLVSEKRRMVQGSSLLEFFDLDEGLDDVGGLQGLKEWVQQRVNAFRTDGASVGISNPKGVLLAGVQGCGKSLSAKAIARVLGFPLIRMDLGNLLEAGRGASEQNLRDVLRVMETIAPAVLWLEEIDKAFSGLNDTTSDPAVSRIVGRFLTWLQEHTSPVFVVATANNVAGLPPELLRRGRFDELFFVDLPTYEERQSIFRIHLQRRGWKPEKFEIDALATATEGYSGAEIETIVNSAIIESHAAGRMPTQADLDLAREQTVPLSITMEDEIFALREWARTRCRPATLENRVMRIMEEEVRRGEIEQEQQAPLPKWKQLAEHGQLSPALLEYVREQDHVHWHDLLFEFSDDFEVAGQFGLVLKANPKVVIWTRLDRELVDAVSDLLASKRLYLHYAQPGPYADQGHPQLNVIEAVPTELVTTPCWLPTKFRLIPPPEGSSTFGRLARIRMSKAGQS